ncbi:MAG: hypothetical protein IT367_18195 [Candidatus Hydrogenedentes bacterium]|nr:hypothetical protein [Candidatus Hydrogenedentota bacterium]
MRVVDVARICHEANRAYCLSLGEAWTEANWNNAAQDVRDSAIAGVKFRLANLDALVSAQHEAWFEGKRAQGWVYGPVKDAMQKTHPCMVPFEALPMAQQGKDALFVNIVRAMAPYVEVENAEESKAQL